MYWKPNRLYLLPMNYRSFDELIPPDVVNAIIDEGNHPSDCAYRALKRSNESAISEDFLPSFEDITQPSFYIPPELRDFTMPGYIKKGQSSYGMSLFNDLSSLKRLTKDVASMRKHVIGFAQGKTDFAKGIAGAPDSETHFEYFLYNSKEKNPCVDFNVIEKRAIPNDNGK